MYVSVCGCGCVLGGREEGVKEDSQWELLVELRRTDFLLRSPADLVDILDPSKSHL